MGFNVNLTSLEAIRKQLMDYVANRYGVEIFNTTTAGFLVDLVAVLLGYMQISRSVFLREANLDTAVNPANFYELVSNYGYLLSPCIPLTWRLKYTGTDVLYVYKWDVVGSVKGYDVVAKENKVLNTGDFLDVVIGYYEQSEIKAVRDYDTVYEMNKGKFLGLDELERFNLSAYPFDLLNDKYMVLRSAGLWRTKFFFGSGVVGGYLANYPLKYRRISFDEDIKTVFGNEATFLDKLVFDSVVQKNTEYLSMEEFRSGIARYSIDKRLVSRQDYELFIKEYYNVYDCKVYDLEDGSFVVRFMTDDVFLDEDVLYDDLEKRRIIGSKFRLVKEDLMKGQDIEIRVRSMDRSVVEVIKKNLLYKYIKGGTKVNEYYINSVLYQNNIVGYVVRVDEPVTIVSVDTQFGYGFLKEVNIVVRE